MIFSGGTVTSDGGVLFLRTLESQMGLVSRMVDALRDRRHPIYIDHTLLDLVKQRVFQIACGYEDAVDCDELRHDPGIKAACDRLPLSGPDLGSQSVPTLPAQRRLRLASRIESTRTSWHGVGKSTVQHNTKSNPENRRARCRKDTENPISLSNIIPAQERFDTDVKTSTDDRTVAS